MKKLNLNTAKKLFKIALSCFALTLTTTSWANDVTEKLDIQSREIANRLDAYLTKTAQKDFSGALLVEYKGQKILSKGYGFADKKKRINYTSNTISDIGSVSKQFTAAAILKLEMQGKLSTKDNLSKYFKDISSDKAAITLDNLLSMSSGLHMYSGGDYQPVTEKEFIEIVDKQPLHFEPGTSFEYSNPNYSILALLIERISGMSYESYLYKYLFQPAGMENTGYSRPNFGKDNIAVQHHYSVATQKPTEKQWEGEQPYLHLKGNGGILSTVEDMYKWHKALQSELILSNMAKKKYFQPYFEAFKSKNVSNSYAYGWYTRETPRETTLVYHQGSNNESYADFFRFIDEDATFILVSNNFDGFSEKLNKQINELIFKPNFKPLDKYGYKSLHELTKKNMTTEQIVTFLRNEASNPTSSDYHISLWKINRFGYSFVIKNKLEDAQKILKLNTELYPNSSDAYDYYAESLLLSGDIKAGIEAYKKALELNPKFSNAHTAHRVIKEYESFMSEIGNIFN